MIVAASTDKKTIIIGLCPEDYEILKTGQTLVKQGHSDFGFRSLVVFGGENNEAMLKLLTQHGTKHLDDPKNFNFG